MYRRREFIRTFTSAATLGAVHLSLPAGRATEAPDYNYRRPAFPKASRLVFLGDSITDMEWGRNERDRNHYLGHSYVYLLASRLGTDMPKAGLEFFNRGISGNKVGDLKKRWRKDAVDMQPDLLSVLIGVNDISKARGKPVPVDQWEADYRDILDQSTKANGKLRLVLLDPFVLRSGRLKNEAAWKTYRGECDRLRRIVAQLANDYDAVHIKTQSIFDQAAAKADPAHWIWDGVHPLPQGHELIAREWLKQVSARWPG
jgi:lysophospholipase L1-like esterase